MNKNVFISYSSEDKNTASKICFILEEQGIECWIAPRDIEPGQNYGEAIIEAIETTQAMILVLSDYSNESTHVRNEVERAVSKGKTVFPVRIREVKPSRALELFISASQWVDAFSPGLESKVKQLSSGIKELFKIGQSDIASQEPEEKREQTKAFQENKAEHLKDRPSFFINEPPDSQRYVEIPERQIETDFSVLNLIMDRDSGEKLLRKRIPKDRSRKFMGDYTHLRIDTTNIASPIRTWEDEENFFEIIPYIEGWTFTDIIALNQGIFSTFLQSWCLSLLQIVNILQKHDPPLIHRDIKPSNVMVRKDDLSSLVLIDCTTMISYPVSEEVVAVGSQGYAPPEVLANKPNLSSDLYSLGCTLFSLNRGVVPPSPTQIEHFGQKMTLNYADDVVAAIFPRLIALHSEERFPNAATAWDCMQKELRKSPTTREALMLNPMILPDGRKIPQFS